MRYILILLMLIPLITFSQQNGHWHHLDPNDDKVLGAGITKAYNYLQNRIPDTVIVAIVDNGAELSHNDLNGTFWINKNEIPGNGVDDDANGYIDDIHGWNFIGNPDGQNLKLDTKEVTRIYGRLHKLYQDKSLSDIKEDQLEEFMLYYQVKEDYESRIRTKEFEIEACMNVLVLLESNRRILEEYFGNDSFTIEQVREIETKDLSLSVARNFICESYDRGETPEAVEKLMGRYKKELATRLNTEFKNRETIVGDNPYDINDTVYGNNQLQVRGPYHGTGVASIVGALKNGEGPDGIARNVKLMIIRIVPNGDERDKDVALAIRYAVRNGADIVNCSFAKKYSSNPEFVQRAVDEAEKAGVLIVQGAGNSSVNTDSTPYYPNGFNTQKNKSGNWITVGASMPDDNKNLVAYFSNYGKTMVDIYAPGYGINVCALNNSYGQSSGTSSAAPVVAGVAAVLKSYFPELSGAEIKDILIRSAHKPNTKEVVIPGKQYNDIAEFKEMSISGGIVNLYNAIILAEQEAQNRSGNTK